MKHLQEARALMADHESIDPKVLDYIKLEGNSVTFTIQDGPVKEAGVNGCQAYDMLKYVEMLFRSLNSAFPCEQNKETIEMLKEAAVWQRLRTMDREKRGVEGTSKA